ncbi:hypothetical protein BV25DRAFT_1867938 [Artomyces pyxidatus]|uniref:Uncharacterized protein n=1 Tax=Artomyces pyxidatus TaxID=48021 RepID=A0ACB8TEB7_9AGAM|nr:hypothetical protein BV25DRAFT_1867938 [Artomyces pyxidatus]
MAMGTAGKECARSFKIDLLREWLPLRDNFLDELIRLEGLGRHPEVPLCTSCNEVEACTRCTDCIGSPLVCKACLCGAHQLEPFHRVQKWNGSFFADYSLARAGFILQLGHDGLSCPNPRPHTTTLTVIDITGIHKIYVKFCDCADSRTANNYIQVLRARLWPATVKRPRTATTLRTCKLFHALTLQGKTNAYDFWNALCRITNSSGLRRPKNHYKDFIRTMRCFRNLRMAKRGGRAHDPGGIDRTDLGELVVECPACPHPGRNLPDGWEDAPESEKWKYAIMFAIDANFKLKLKNRGLEDVKLAPGWSYFVDDEPYQAHIETYKDQVEMKHCSSNFAANDLANVPAQKRFAINGVGSVICARHCFYLKNGIGDLQRGERYCNMDFVLLSTIAKVAEHLKTMVLSYDIACQFSKNFLKRMAEFPAELRIDVTQTSLTFVVPKFHLLAHGESCQVSYSLNFTEGVGRTCGEGIEAGWSDTNGAALSTREMSSESRHEALDDFFGAINWRKTTSLGSQLRKSLKEAVPALEKHMAAYEEHTATFPQAVLDRWERMIEAWDKDRKMPNPYHEPAAVHTVADVRLELAQQEAADAARGIVSLHETSASVFLSTGLELEDAQRLLQVKAKAEDAKTAAGRASLQEKRNALQHRIKNWRALQLIYMPASSALIAKELSASTSPSPTSSSHGTTANAVPAVVETPGTTKIENEKLWLPLDIPRELWSPGLAPGLIDKAIRLRVAQAEEALHNLRRQLRIRKGLIHYKHVFVDGPGQKANTRARSAIKNLSARMDRHTAQYRAARAALVVLSPDGSWQGHLRELRAEDIRAPREDDGTVGEGHRETSWIWRVLAHEARDIPGGETDLSEEEVHENLRVDWVKSRARARRWNEEIIHLREEMPRSIKFLDWKAAWWASRAELRPDAPADIRSGLSAYAARQAAVFSGLAAQFKAQWTKALEDYGLDPIDWPVSLPTQATPESLSEQAAESSHESHEPHEPQHHAATVHGKDADGGAGSDSDSEASEYSQDDAGYSSEDSV